MVDLSMNSGSEQAQRSLERGEGSKRRQRKSMYVNKRYSGGVAHVVIRSILVITLNT